MISPGIYMCIQGLFITNSTEKQLLHDSGDCRHTILLMKLPYYCKQSVMITSSLFNFILRFTVYTHCVHNYIDTMLIALSSVMVH